MKRPPIILVASAALVLVAGIVQAQQVVPVAIMAPDTARAPAGSAYVPTPSLFEGMQLTKAQQDSIDALKGRFWKLNDVLNQERDIRIRERQFLAMRAKYRQDQRAVLTPAQQKLFDPRAAAQQAEDERTAKATIARMEARGH